ncbi:MAG: C25 family cysteine peptidase, partial [Myxococcota bacterium]
RRGFQGTRAPPSGPVSDETLFDHYTDGKPTADAIRRFVEDTEKHDLRYVLLVGNAKSNGIQSPLPTGYLPSGWVNASIGRAPSDQWFVQHPSARKVAIGRLPVTSTEEARLLVRKTLDYATQSNGPWQRRIVWYQDREAPYELQERRIAEMSERGFESIVLSPATPNLRSATVDWLDRGALLTHFKGHGFRTYLRVGAAGAAEDAYVLQAEDLARESTSPHQTIFVALSCYTAEFTHPTSTSVAEQLLLRPKGGAVAVLAPTWANWPGFTLTRGFFEGLTPGATVGQASRNARDFVNRPALRLQYVLLGDPALPIPIARPEAN